jgi:uncharacterized small protein (DUF1192 family)
MAHPEDDPFAPRAPAGTGPARPLDQMGIGELEERIAALEDEIATCRGLIERKRGAKAAADSVFGRRD